MTQEHFELVLDALLDRKPFNPFTVQLATGTQFEVDHPRATVIRDGVAVYLQPGGRPVWFDHDSVTSISDDLADQLIE